MVLLSSGDFMCFNTGNHRGSNSLLSILFFLAWKSLIDFLGGYWLFNETEIPHEYLEVIRR